MKKLLTVAVLASAAAAYAVDIEVGTVGVTEISPVGKDTIVVTSYNELDGSGAMAVSNIVKTANLPENTKLYVLNGANEYEGYTLKFVSGTTGPKYWDRDKNYTVNSAGVLSEGSDSSSTAKGVLQVGTGFWISLPEAPASTQRIYVYGKPPAATNVTMTANSVTLVGNPTQTAKPPTITGMAQGDKIMVFGTEGTTTYRSTGTVWQKVGESARGASATIMSPIPAGTGFWYISKGTATIDWTK